MQLPIRIGKEAFCLNGWQDITDEETVSKITSATKFFRYLLLLDNFRVLHLAAIPCLKMAKRLTLYLLLNQN